MNEKKTGKGLNKQLLIIAIAAIAVLGIIAGLTIKSYRKSFKKFQSDGYVLNPSESETVTTDVGEQYYFSKGTNYREKYGTSIEFKDSSNKKVSISTKEFVHYNDGSLASFSDGVVMSLENVADKQVTYYGVSENTTLVREGQLYQMSYLGNAMQMQEYVWKIADDTYMVVAPQITLYLGEDNSVIFNDYVQVQYVDGGIVRLIHQEGTYQTISNSAYLITDGGVSLQLMDKTFYVDGAGTVSLDDMVIDSSENLQLDDDDEVKIPTFNVINGTDGNSGASGNTGTDGNTGDTGEQGDEGDRGNKGSAGSVGAGGAGGVIGADGEVGYSGYNGANGSEGAEGDRGIIGYNGDPGQDGEDALSKDDPDGIASVDIPTAPRVTLSTDKYEITANSVSMALHITDDSNMLSSDLSAKIYKRDDMTVAYSGTISQGSYDYIATTSSLLPGTEYVLVVNGNYMYEGSEYNSDFFTKVFTTDSIGIKLEKVQITEDSVKVKTTLDDDTDVATYGIAMYDMSGNIISSVAATFSTDNEFTFKKNSLLTDGEELTHNTEYIIRLTNLTSKSNTLISSDVSLDVTTLKEEPYYEDGDSRISVGATTTKAIGSERYKTVTVSLDTAIVDNDNGITGYRYELYQTATGGTDSLSLVDSKTVEGMTSVAFNVDSEKSYIGRVVVLFNDNEKNTEIPAAYSKVVTIGKVTYPTVSFESVVTNYDKVSGYVKVIDNYGMLLDHVNDDYPLVLSFTSEAGDTIKVNLTDETVPSGVSGGDENTKYYAFDVDSLRRNTKYTISVAGAVNTYVSDNKIWSDLSSSEKEGCKNFYLAGINVDTGSPTTLSAVWKDVSKTSSSIFDVKFGLTSSTEAGDASYESGNLDKVTFKLINANTGLQIGQDATFVDTNSNSHNSDFEEAYNDAGTSEDSYTYFTTSLTPESFGAASDSRLAGGGTFSIVVNKAYDYTENKTDDKPEYTNELDFDTTTTTYTFTVETRHTAVDNPNSIIRVVEITNAQAFDAYHDDNLDDDTVVGLKIYPDYQWDDAKSITYYVYDISDYTDIIINSDTTLTEDMLTGITPLTRTITKTSESTVNDPWMVYFDEDSPTSAYTETYPEYRNYCSEDGSDSIYFERGHEYFIRYVIECDGSLNSETSYPNCLYESGKSVVYRSVAFGLNRQKAKIYRYLWDSENSIASGNLNIEWKYKIVDPDGAVIDADSKLNIFADNSADTTHSTTAIDLSIAKGDYATISIDGIPKNQYYQIAIHELLCNMQQDANNVTYDYATEKDQATATESLTTAILTASNYKNASVKANGVVVRGVSIVNAAADGVIDEGGYRIKITLQGDKSLLEKVAALKVKITGENDAGESKTVYYDPIAITYNNGLTSDGNYYAFAYLDYDKVVEAGLNSRDVKLSVSAYYLTGRKGSESFVNRSSSVSTDGQFTTDDTAWALRCYTKDEDTNTLAGEYFWYYDEKGNLTASPLVTQTAGQFYTPGSSVFLPQFDSSDNNIGLTIDTDGTSVFKLNNMYGTAGLSLNSEISQDGIDADGIGRMEIEELKVVDLQCALNIETTDEDYADYKTSGYKTITFLTGDGMYGVAYDSDASSIGMSSADLYFKVLGGVPYDDDTSIYFKLYDSTGTEITVTKCVDDIGIYYKVGALETGENTATDTKGCIPYAYNSKGDYVNFAIRGLDSETDYYVMLYSKDSKGTLQPLFDYVKEMVGYKYNFTTNKNVTVEVASDIITEYKSYTDKKIRINFAIDGNEGMYMRTFYKIYDSDNNEIKVGNGSYTDGKGYVITPLGNSTKYYSNALGSNNPAYVEFTPGGDIEAGKSYKVVFNAYTSKNDGTITDEKVIGTNTMTFTAPSTFKTPYAQVRVVPSEDQVQVVAIVTNTDRSIIDDDYEIQLLDENDNIVDSKTYKATDGTTSTVNFRQTVTFSENISKNTTYKVRVYAKVDSNNDGVKDEEYVKEVFTSTVSSATATVVTSFNTTSNLEFTLRDLVNFDGVTKIIATIDSDDGSENLWNKTTNLTAWTADSTTNPTQYYYKTDWTKASSGKTYVYTLQYYNSSDKLIGSTTGYFTK